MMWIDAVRGLIGQVYSEADKHNRRTGLTLVVRTQPLGWFWGKR